MGIHRVYIGTGINQGNQVVHLQLVSSELNGDCSVERVSDVDLASHEGSGDAANLKIPILHERARGVRSRRGRGGQDRGNRGLLEHLGRSNRAWRGSGESFGLFSRANE
jgi:hypothetical protein